MAWQKLWNGFRNLKETVFPNRGSISVVRTAQSCEQLLVTVNALVSTGKLVAGQELLEEALAEGEDPEILDLLGRVYMLQLRPQEAASVIQRALLARRLQSAFIESGIQPNCVVEQDDDAVSDVELEYLSDESRSLAGLNDETVWQHEIVESSNPLSDHLIAVGADSDIAQIKFVEHPTLDTVLPAEGGHPPAKARKILSLSKRRKSETLDPDPAGVKVIVKNGFQPSEEGESPVTATVDAAVLSSNSDVAPVDDSLKEHSQPFLREPEGFYSESDIFELVTGTDYSLAVSYDADEELDYYELEDADHFNSDVLFDEPADLDENLENEPAAAVDEIEDEYAAYAFDPDEHYDTQGSVVDDSSDLPDGKISREDRALQKAAELISNTGWPLSAWPLIQQIFVMSGWGATRLALEREIEKGMSPNELILAAHVKVIWAENDYYWIAYDKNGSSKLSQYVLSWPTALLIVRCFESLPQIEEIEQFIESLFEYWYERIHLRKVFRSFNRFLWFRVSNLHGCLPANLPFNFESPYELPMEEYSDLGLTDMLEIERTAQLGAFGVFQSKHPQEPGCYVSDKPLPVEEYSVTTDKKTSRHDVVVQEEHLQL